jgi:hypothetical protein
MSRRGETKKKYTKEEKYEVAVYYMLYGSQAQASKMTGIPPRIISYWVNEDEEFKELYDLAVHNGRVKFDAMTSSIIDQTLQLTDRKIKHELQLLKEGEGKLSAKDAALTAKVLWDMRQISRNLPTSIQEKKTTDHLDELAKKFEQIAGVRVREEKEKEEDETKRIH